MEYRTDPEEVRQLLPPPLDLADEDAGAVALIWAEWAVLFRIRVKNSWIRSAPSMGSAFS